MWILRPDRVTAATRRKIEAWKTVRPLRPLLKALSVVASKTHMLIRSGQICQKAAGSVIEYHSMLGEGCAKNAICPYRSSRKA
jgi:hypothetical protein